MGQPIAVRTDFAAVEVRRLARRAKDSDQVRRLLAIAAVLDGASRAEAAKVGGMDRQTLRDWVIRFNEQGPGGLINVPAPGAPAKLNTEHRAFLARIVDEGPSPPIDGVVRWRACDLIMRLHEEFGISVSDDTVYRALKASASHTSVPGRERTSRIPRRSRHLKKIPRSRGGNPQQPCARHAGRGVVSG
jgi:transposase